MKFSLVWLLFLPLPAAGAADTPLSAYAGSTACAACHRAQASTQPGTPMAHAMERGADSQILRAHQRLAFQDGEYRYLLTRDGPQTYYSVTGGSQTIRVPVEWAFGKGAAGQTYLLRHNGRWYESRVSYYNAIGGLDLTMGAPNYRPHSVEEAVGRPMGPRDTHDCFDCHATDAVEGSQVRFDGLIPGVQCENCHGPAAQHIRAASTGDLARAKMPRLGKLSSEEMSDFCGRCHRTWSQIALSGPHDIRNVRFQPYRLANSKCYDSADRRIGCTACHDPHRNAESRPAAYDAKCLACHGNGGRPRGAKTCATATENCVTCHMPKIKLPGSHNRFSDHTIRIVKAHEPVPN